MASRPARNARRHDLDQSQVRYIHYVLSSRLLIGAHCLVREEVWIDVLGFSPNRTNSTYEASVVYQQQTLRFKIFSNVSSKHPGFCVSLNFRLIESAEIDLHMTEASQVTVLNCSRMWALSILAHF